MGISLAGAVGNLLNNYEAGKEKQAAIQRQTAQQTLQNAVAQQRLDLEQQQHQDTENQTLASLMQQGWTPQQPTLNAAPPLQTVMAGGINPAPTAPTTAPDPNAMSVNIGGKALYLPGASSKPAQRTAQIQALIQTFKSRYGQDLDPALAAYYHDTPAALDTAVKAMETANSPSKEETADQTNRKAYGAYLKLNGLTQQKEPYDPNTGYAALMTGQQQAATLAETAKDRAAARAAAEAGHPVAVLDPSDPLHKKVIYVPAAQAMGMERPSSATSAAGSAPLMSKEGQFGEMLKKAPDLFKAAEQLDVTAGQSAARDIAENGVGVFGMHVPGTKGIGAMMLNNSPAYSTYQAALMPFVIANAHAVSGARYNKDQGDAIRRSIERQPGDLGNPSVVAQRDKNVIDAMNSIAGSLPPDAVARQEAQLDPAVLQSLVARGYKTVGNSGGGTGPKTSAADRWEQLVRGGMDKAQATAQVQKEFGHP